jgi:hypothetical protein
MKAGVAEFALSVERVNIQLKSKNVLEANSKFFRLENLFITNLLSNSRLVIFYIELAKNVKG